MMGYKGLPATELRMPAEAVFTSDPCPEADRHKLLVTKLPDGTILEEEFPTGMQEEQRRRIAHMAFRAVFADKPEYFKTPSGGKPVFLLRLPSETENCPRTNCSAVLPWAFLFLLQ